MKDQDVIGRFEELEAGRILGDLDAAEMDEWETLVRDPRCQPDLSLELTAAALEAEFRGGKDLDLPTGLLEELQKRTAGFVVEDLSEDAEEKVVQPPLWRRILSDRDTAWAIAAIFIILFVTKSFVDEPPSGAYDPILSQVAPEVARQTLMQDADDLIRSSFGGVGDYEAMSGEVVWSDVRQEGYLTLSDLPANDPKARQYQLWIVDPERDEKPVDGGVFDIPSGGGTIVISIRNPLVVRQPKAFVITLEQPGGVVVSKQKDVVALAKTS